MVFTPWSVAPTGMQLLYKLDDIENCMRIYCTSYEWYPTSRKASWISFMANDTRLTFDQMHVKEGFKLMFMYELHECTM